MSNLIEPNMIKGGSYRSTLKDLIHNNKVIPLSVFFKTNNKQAIEDAIKYLKEKKYGSVFIPPEDNIQNDLIINVVKDKKNLFKINYVTSSYRHPINNEKRPYTNEDWGIGDIVYNTETNINKCYGWICVTSGTPGEWEQIGTIQPFNTYVELVNDLPKASIPQLGRQLRYKLNNKECLFICKEEDGKARWVQQDHIIGNTDDRPLTAPNGTWYYNTDVDRYEWYSEKASKWFRFEQMQDEFDKWSREVESISKESKNLLRDMKAKWDKEVSNIEKESEDILNDIKNKYDSNALEALIIWKSPVDTFNDLKITYPKPELGWTVRIEYEKICYRYDGNKWMIIGDVMSGNQFSIGENGNWYINSKDSEVLADARKINQSLYNIAKGLANKQTKFNDDGSITEIMEDGELITRVNEDGSISETFTSKFGEVITKVTKFKNDEILEEIV